MLHITGIGVYIGTTAVHLTYRFSIFALKYWRETLYTSVLNY